MVPESDERGRVIPVIEGLRRRLSPSVRISIDTYKAGTARAAVAAGASVINDVSGFRIDPRLREIAAAREAGVVLMHSRGGVAEMGTYRYAEYGSDVVVEVIGELTASVQGAR